MTKEKIIEILEVAKDRNGDVPFEIAVKAINKMAENIPPEQTRVFVELVVEYPDPELCTYKEYKGKPYYSIKYIENGETYVGYGTYNPEVLSQYLKEYFISPAQPDLSSYSDKLWRNAYERGKAEAEPKWIPVSERLPEEGEYVLISKKPTKLSGSKWCVTIAIRTADPRSGKIHWRDIGFGVIPDDDVLVWMPRPEHYREENR